MRTSLAANCLAWTFSSSLRTLARSRWASPPKAPRSSWIAPRSLHQLHGPGRKRLLAEIELGDLRFRPEDAPSRLLRAGDGPVQLLPDFGDGSLPLLLAFFRLPHPGPEISQAFFALGQLDFGLRGLAVLELAVGLQAIDLLAQGRQLGFHLRQGGFAPRLLFTGVAQGMEGRIVLDRGGLPFRAPAPPAGGSIGRPALPPR